MKKEMHKEALQNYQRIIGHGPNDQKIYINMALCYQGLGQIKDAKSCLEKSIAINPDYFLPQKMLKDSLILYVIHQKIAHIQIF